MLWISEFFFCVGSMTLTGAIASILYLLFRERLMKAKPGITIRILKMIILLYVLPIAYGAVRIMRIDSNVGFFANKGYFGVSMLPDYIKVFGVVGMIWIAGLVVGILTRLRQRRMLRTILRANVPVMDKRWSMLVDEQCEKFHLRHVEIYQNERVFSPFTTNIFRPIIVLPLLEVSELQMRMIVEHEMCHIRSRDLLWKRISLWVSWLHWFNPVAHLVQDWLALEQEIECDLFICGNTTRYTAKEYYSFILTLIESTTKLIYASTLFESKSTIVRRIEAMKEKRNRKRAGKAAVLACSLALVLVSAIPAYAMMEGVASLDEARQRAAEATYVDADGQENSAVEICVVETETVNEVEVNAGVAEYSSLVVISLTADANTRYSYKMQYMEVGDEVGITVQCSDSDAVFWIGIKNVYNGEARYVQGTGTLSHTFTIKEAGYYRAFVENRTSGEVEFLGSAVYPN